MRCGGCSQGIRLPACRRSGRSIVVNVLYVRHLEQPAEYVAYYSDTNTETTVQDL